MSGNGNQGQGRESDPRSESGDATAPSTSRRDFTRRAATGAAAVAMLGNRPAWGNFVGTCVSSNAWASLNGGATSLTPGRFEEELDLEQDLRNQAANDPNSEFDEATGCLITNTPP